MYSFLCCLNYRLYSLFSSVLMDLSKNHQLSPSTPPSYEDIEKASMFLNVLIDNRKMSSTIVSRYIRAIGSTYLSNICDTTIIRFSGIITVFDPKLMPSSPLRQSCLVTFRIPSSKSSITYMLCLFYHSQIIRLFRRRNLRRNSNNSAHYFMFQITILFIL